MTSLMTSSHLTLSDLERLNSRPLRFRNLISCKGAELGHMLLLNINRKAYMGSQIRLSHLTLSDLERSNLRSLTFQSLISCKGAELGHMLLLNINRKAYMESPMTSSHLTLKGQNQGHSNFKSLYLIKELSQAITLKHKQETIYGESSDTITFDLE